MICKIVEYFSVGLVMDYFNILMTSLSTCSEYLPGDQRGAGPVRTGGSCRVCLLFGPLTRDFCFNDTKCVTTPRAQDWGNWLPVRLSADMHRLPLLSNGYFDESEAFLTRTDSDSAVKWGPAAKVQRSCHWSVSWPRVVGSDGGCGSVFRWGD